MAPQIPHRPTQPGPFRFFDLPSEIRFKILSLILSLDRTIDLDPLNNYDAAQRLAIFLASRRLHSDASYVFCSGHTFRVFPTHSSFFGNNVQPLLSRLAPRYRRELITLELRLGPGWANPPKSWQVSERMGFEDMVGVRKVKVFMECDPSQEVFRSFRRARDFFTNFARTLLEEMIKRLPNFEEVEFDGYRSVRRDGPLVMKLIGEAKRHGKRVTWGSDISSRSSLEATDDHDNTSSTTYEWSTDDGDFHV